MATPITLKSKNPGPAIPLQSLGGIIVPANGGGYTDVVPDVVSEIEFLGIYSQELAALVASGDIILVVGGIPITDTEEAASWADVSTKEGIVTEQGEIQTTDASPSLILSESLGEGVVIHADIVVVARSADETEYGSYRFCLTAGRRTGEGAMIQGNITVLHTQETNPAWEVAFSVDGGDLSVLVTGQAGKTINWKCKWSCVEM